MRFKNIFLSAFAKAKKDSPGSTKRHWAQHISDVLDKEYGYQVNENRQAKPFKIKSCKKVGIHQTTLVFLSIDYISNSSRSYVANDTNF